MIEKEVGLMLFQTLFKKQKPINHEKNASEKLLVIVNELLNKELPEHQSQHHILFTANVKLDTLKNVLNQHRSRCQLEHKVGQYHMEMYDQIRKQISDLQGLVNCYTELHIDMTHMNHRLLFYYDKINYLYENYLHLRDGTFLREANPSFWKAIKEDTLEVVRNIL